MSRYRKPAQDRKQDDKKQELSKKEIQEKLKGYKRMTDIKQIKPGMAIRYLSKTQNDVKYRSGGILTYIDPQGRFLRCRNIVDKTKSWSVQLKTPGLQNIIFYKDLLAKRKNDQNLANKVKDLLKNLDGNFEFLGDALDVLGGVDNPDKVDKTLDIIFNKFDGKIENVFIELKKLREENRRLKGDDTISINFK